MGTKSPQTPRWVKVFGVAAAILVLAFIAAHLSGHGMGDHGLPGGSADRPASPGGHK